MSAGSFAQRPRGYALDEASGATVAPPDAGSQPRRRDSPAAARTPPLAAVRRAPLAIHLLLAGAAIAVYLSSLAGGYAFDDRFIIVENPIVQKSSLSGIFTSAYMPGPVYRPVTLLTFAINERLGWNPMADHVCNVALHALITLLVYAVAGRVVRSQTARVVATLLFAVHPIHSEAVANIVGRAELLAAVFALTALLAFARSLEAKGSAGLWFSVALVSFAIGPFAKESALTILPVIVLFQRLRAPHTPWRSHFAVGAAFVAAALPYIAARMLVTGALTYPERLPFDDNPLAWVAPQQRVATALVILVEYLGLLIAPITLSADYSYNEIPVVTTLGDPRLWFAVAVLGGGAVLLWKVRHRAPALIFCTVFMACTLSLTANVLFSIGTIKGERLLYLPSVGWCMGAGLVAAWGVRRYPTAVVVALCALLVFFSGRTWIRGYDWRDDATIIQVTSRTAPNSAKAQYNFGAILLEQGAPDDATVQFRRALEIDPRHRQAAFGIGRIYERKGIEVGALHWYANATEIDWQFPVAHLRTGLLRHRLGEHATAEAAIRTGLEQHPNHPLLLLALGAVRLEQGDVWEARQLVYLYDKLAWTVPADRDALAAMRHSIMDALTS